MSTNPLDDAPLCPTCHSKISPNKKRRIGQDGTDSNDNPVPAWSDDPLLTATGLSGPDYIGGQLVAEKHITEIQDARKQQEIDLGIVPLTEFSTITPGAILGQLTHLVELRISTERILETTGTTLEEYFKLDIDGNEQPPGPNDITKIEWTDVKRGATFKPLGLNSSILVNNNKQFKINDTDTRDVPSLEEGAVLIKAIHIEDLRHPILLGLFEKFSPTIPSEFEELISPPLVNFPQPIQEHYTSVAQQEFSTALKGNIFRNYKITNRAVSSGQAQGDPPGSQFLAQAYSKLQMKFLDGVLSNGNSHIINILHTTDNHSYYERNSFSGLSDTKIDYISLENNYIVNLIKIRQNTKGKVYLDYNFNNQGRLSAGQEEFFNEALPTPGSLAFKYRAEVILLFHPEESPLNPTAKIHLRVEVKSPLKSNPTTLLPYAQFVTILYLTSPPDSLNNSFYLYPLEKYIKSDFQIETIPATPSTPEITLPYIPLDLSYLYYTNPALFDTTRYFMSIQIASTLGNMYPAFNVPHDFTPPSFGVNVPTELNFHGIKIV